MALSAGVTLSAQTTAADVGFTPYSIFGIGDIASEGSSYNQAMGGIGIGDRNVKYLNYLNPAAVTARQTNSFMMDFGLKQKNTYFAAKSASSDNILHSADNTFNMDHLVMSFPIGKHSAFKLGVAPFSNTGYSFSSAENNDELISEVGDISYYQLGQGGITKAFTGAGVTFFKRLSVGVDGEFYFGNITRYSVANFNSSSAYRSVTSGENYSLKGVGAKFGLQYEQPLGKKHKAVIGATYDLGSSLGGSMLRFAYASSDTVVNERKKIDGFSIPSELGVGVTFKKADDRWKVGFDYTQRDWTGASLLPSPGSVFKAAKARAFRGGFEFTPNPYDMRYWYKHITYRGGVYHEKSYISFNGNQVDAYGITLGASLPVFRYFNSVNISMDFGQRGSLSLDQIRERYFAINVSFALHDIWFLKPMYD